ncbi:MAG: bifunctional (p)ppGpp synthetase/guanosine-3',5'-bis(diphosphate) 3'-pyrophosphohydrolase [Nitrospinae bacterium]|nr:bifunctional (p)ppGpp synthetase/guanosine-3',5'-bis(diphosphate) 3'-pyrophosphohydrolase [Nitrospinota bacterium]
MPDIETADVAELSAKVLSYNPHADAALIERAYHYAAKSHEGQTRVSGLPYLSHPLGVATILAELRMDSVTIGGGLLHDTVEDCGVTVEQLKEQFGAELALIVDGVTKLGQMEFSRQEERQAETFRKMLLAMAKDIRVILVKLADRLHNMRTLEHLPERKQLRIAQETLDIYAPLANRLGIYWVKSELEDTAFKYLNPEAYHDIDEKIASGRKERDQYVAMVKDRIGQELEAGGIKARGIGRPKHFYGIYQKMLKQNISFDDVFDLIGLRIITDSVRNCYATLGTLHSLWKPVPGRFKDFIALPKPNMYQSLHTTVIGPQGERVEFQIRTEEMHKTAEQGIAAHWRYKEGSKGDEKVYEKFTWLRHLLEWQQEMKDAREFMETVKIDLFPEEVYVFTPRGDVKSFPRGATPIDFAYSIHTEIGHKCVGAKINGRMVPLKYQLHNGDAVEILTNPNHFPSKDWLKIVKTARARSKIRAWIKAVEKERSISLGRQLLEREIQKYGLNPASFLKSGEMTEIAKRFSFTTPTDLMAEIGFGKVSVNQVLARLLPKEVLEARQKPVKTEQKPGATHEVGGVKVKGVEDIMTRYAHCCNPVPGDDIVGFITIGRGVSIHTADCDRIVEYTPERMVEVEWDVEEVIPHPVGISVVTVDRPGMLAKISSAIALCEVNIREATVTTTEEQRALLNFVIDINDLNHLQKVMKTIRQVKGVISVVRVKDWHGPRKRNM